jgi:hypothetical protein
MVSVQMVKFNSPNFKGFSDDDAYDVQRRLEAKYQQVGKGGRVAPALVLTAIGAIGAGRITKVATDNALSTAITKKVSNLTKPVREAIIEFVKKHPLEIKNERVSKAVTTVADFAKNKIIAFAKFGNENGSVAKGLIKNTATLAGAAFGFKTGFADKNGNGVSDVKETFHNASENIKLISDFAALAA